MNIVISNSCVPLILTNYQYDEFIAYHFIRTVTLNFPDFTSILTKVFIYVLKLVVI